MSYKNIVTLFLELFLLTIDDKKVREYFNKI